MVNKQLKVYAEALRIQVVVVIMMNFKKASGFSKDGYLCALLGAAMLFWTLGAEAADNGDVIKYRQAVYSSIGGQMTAMGSVLQGKVPHTGDLPTLAYGLSSLAGLIPHLFPEGSGEGKTNALPLIWEEFDDFQQRLENMQIAAEALAEVAANQDMQAFAQAFQNLGRACKSCHDKFKAE